MWYVTDDGAVNLSKALEIRIMDDHGEKVDVCAMMPLGCGKVEFTPLKMFDDEREAREFICDLADAINNGDTELMYI